VPGGQQLVDRSRDDLGVVLGGEVLSALDAGQRGAEIGGQACAVVQLLELVGGSPDHPGRQPE
jgi:hypothetical protein